MNISAGSIVLTGGLQPENVIFLFDPGTSGQNINWNCSGKFSGILLGTTNVGSFSLVNTLNTGRVGRVIDAGGSIQFTGGDLQERELFQSPQHLALLV